MLQSWADALRPLLVAGLEELFDAAAAFDDKAEGDRTAADAEAEQASLRRVLASLFDRLNAPDVVTAVAAVPRYTRIQRAILRGLLPVHGKAASLGAATGCYSLPLQVNRWALSLAALATDLMCLGKITPVCKAAALIIVNDIGTGTLTSRGRTA